MINDPKLIQELIKKIKEIPKEDLVEAIRMIEEDKEENNNE